MSPSRTSWSSPPAEPSCAVLGTMRLLLRWCGVERAATTADAGGRWWSAGSAALPGAAGARGSPRAAAARTGRAVAAVLRRAVRARAVRRRGCLLARDRLRTGLLRGRLIRLGLLALRAHGLLAR